jgi:predicted metalloendopeptidase
VKLNGKLTLGENTADNGGMRLAWMALQDSLAKKPLGVVDGFTPEQRFFIGWAQICVRTGPTRSRGVLVTTDPHFTRAIPGERRGREFPRVSAGVQLPAVAPTANANVCRVW